MCHMFVLFIAEFKTCFDLAKSSAGNLAKVSENGDEQRPAPPTLEVPAVIENFLETVSKTGTIW